MPATYQTPTAGVNPSITQGVSLWLSSDGTTYYPLQYLTKIDAPQIKSSSINITSLSDTFEKYMKGLPDYGEVTGEYEYDYDSNVTAMIETNYAGNGSAAALYFTLKFQHLGTPKMYTFQGFFTEHKIATAGPNDKITASFTIRLTGALTEVTYA